MKRMHNLSDEEIVEWYNTRFENNELKDIESNLQRYNLVDIMEKLFDAYRILDLFNLRISDSMFADNIEVEIDWLFHKLKGLENHIRRLDELIPDEYCTDEKGGKRIWWDNE